MMKHIHLIGIGGAGLSAIAKVLIEQGFTVSGSDRHETPMLTMLKNIGVQVFVGHAPQNILGADLIIRSSAIPDNNSEVIAALEQGIPVQKRRDFLSTLTQGKRTIAIAGSHGKTTTTAMLVWMFHNMGLDPSFISGGIVSQLSTNAHAGKDDFFIIEADEYDYMFLSLYPEVAIITNVEHDHPDCFPTPADYQAAFKTFIEQVQPGGSVIICCDNPESQALISKPLPARINAYGYGTSENAHYFADQIELIHGYYQFDLIFKNGSGWVKNLGSVKLNLPGYHNVLNATAALGVVHQLNLSLVEAIQSLETFSGVGRRFELLGTAADITIIDDYGHHPSEIAATLEAAHSRYPNHRIWAVWQPHTYTRTQNLSEEFIKSLSLADKILVLKIYAAREASTGYSSKAIASLLPRDKADYADNFDEAFDYLLSHLSANDIAIFFSAGDATVLSHHLLDCLKEQENRL